MRINTAIYRLHNVAQTIYLIGVCEDGRITRQTASARGVVLNSRAAV